MKEFKVAIIQHKVSQPDKEANTNLAVQYIKKQKKTERILCYFRSAG